MLGMHWFNIEEDVQRFRDKEMLVWLYHERPTHTHWKGSEDITFTSAARNKFVRRAPPSLKSFVISL